MKGRDEIERYSLKGILEKQGELFENPRAYIAGSPRYCL